MARSYHLRNSRDNVHKSIGIIRKPRHFVIYRNGKDGSIEITSDLHDSMELTLKLPQDYRAEAEDV
ncbi:hypothetical protein [Polystyrenella longa]|uniref:hypothetical protein n=1 Tax=Polystyrenella longa TaxID=2528007 RepID=UPI00119E5D26|nr:hypothetical protein [Polystyrenella longa]